MVTQRLLAGLFLAIGACAASAAPIAIQNAGFEDPYLGSNLPGSFNGDVPPGTFPIGPAPAGWTIHDPSAVVDNSTVFVGVLNPGTQAMDGTTFFPDGAPEGDNVALLYANGNAGAAPYGIAQLLGVPLQAKTTYSLTVEVGNIATGTGLAFNAGAGEFNLDGFPGYRVQLLAGGIVLAEDDSTLSPGEGLFELSTVDVVTGAAPAQLGLELEIRLINLMGDTGAGTNREVDFDDVRLDATSTLAMLPAPASLWLALLPIGGVALRLRRA